MFGSERGKKKESRVYRVHKMRNFVAEYACIKQTVRVSIRCQDIFYFFRMHMRLYRDLRRIMYTILLFYRYELTHTRDYIDTVRIVWWLLERL